MLDWTGERFLPWERDASIAYEHLHRYAFAATLVKGKRVLDLASGEGYGSNMLAEAAAAVVGVDIDEKTVSHASTKYARANLRFIAGPITSVPVSEDHSFDVIVCFEAIEHIEEHEKLLAEAKRLIKADGMFLVSTPNKVAYEEENPFHVKELYFEEFRDLLSHHFKHVTYLGQRIHAHSNIWPMQPQNTSQIQEFVIARSDSEFEFVSNDRRVPLYVIAVASDASIPLAASGSVLVDCSDEFIKDKDRAIKELLETKTSQEEAIEWRNEQLGDRNKTIASLDEAVKWREEQIAGLGKQIAELQKGLEWTQGRLTETEKTIASHEEALAWRAHQVDDLEKERAALHTHLQNTQKQLNLVTAQLEAILASRGWKLILRLRHIRDTLKGLLKSRAPQ